MRGCLARPQISNQTDYGDIRIGAVGNILKACLHSHQEKQEILPKNV